MCGVCVGVGGGGGVAGWGRGSRQDRLVMTKCFTNI